MTPADAAPTSPHPIDETVAFDDLFVNRWRQSPCVLCHTPRPGHYVLWMERETGFVMMFPLCPRCRRRSDISLQLAYVMHRQLHPEDPRETPRRSTTCATPGQEPNVPLAPTREEIPCPGTPGRRSTSFWLAGIPREGPDGSRGRER